jgi:cytochrome c556
MRTRLITFFIIGITVSLSVSDAFAEKKPQTNLKQIMQGMQTDMSAILGGLFTGNLEQVATSAKAIAYHPPIPASQAQRISATLGPQMSNFAQLDEDVHGQALAVLAAADKKDEKKVTEAFQELVDGCLACHQSYKDQLSRRLNQ